MQNRLFNDIYFLDTLSHVVQPKFSPLCLHFVLNTSIYNSYACWEIFNIISVCPLWGLGIPIAALASLLPVVSTEIPVHTAGELAHLDIVWCEGRLHKTMYLYLSAFSISVFNVIINACAPMMLFMYVGLGLPDVYILHFLLFSRL